MLQKYMVGKGNGDILMKKLILNRWGEHKIVLDIGKYVNNGNLAISMIVELEEDYYEPWSTLTVNLSKKCAPNCAFVDTNNNGDEVVDWIIANKLGRPTGRMEVSGWCFYPEFEFDMDVVNQYLIKEQ